MSHSTQSSSEQERKRDSSACDAINIVTLKQQSKEPDVFLKTSYSQTDRKKLFYRLTEPILSV